MIPSEESPPAVQEETIRLIETMQDLAARHDKLAKILKKMDEQLKSMTADVESLVKWVHSMTADVDL